MDGAISQLLPPPSAHLVADVAAGDVFPLHGVLHLCRRVLADMHCAVHARSASVHLAMHLARQLHMAAGAMQGAVPFTRLTAGDVPMRTAQPHVVATYDVHLHHLAAEVRRAESISVCSPRRGGMMHPTSGVKRAKLTATPAPG
jgi:hypothetical protein